jgi:23S rRNA (uracil1939-C5)-methyltransferase
MQLQKGQIVQLEIDNLAFGGAGVGRHEGLAVFVKGVLPGDKVEASFTRIKPKFAEAKLVKILEKSPKRIEPHCEYFGKCGGCQLQYAPYEEQLKLKRQHVVDCFERIGGFEEAEVEEVIGVAVEDGKPPKFYRNKMEFSFGYDEAMNFVLGMHIPGRRYDILDLEKCYLQSEASVVIVNAVRKFFKEKIGDEAYSPYQYSCGLGFLRSLFVREGKRTGEIMINLATSHVLPGDWKKVSEEFGEMLKNLELPARDGEAWRISSIVWSQVISKRGQRKRIEEEVLFGEEILREKMVIDTAEGQDELTFEIRPQAFFQVNTLQAEVLYAEVLKLVIEVAGESVVERVFDLFCGTGTIGMFVAKHVEEVVGVELNEDSVRAARANATANGISNIEFICGDVGKVLKDISARPDLIIVDPPRAGLSPKMIEKIVEFEAPNIIYVSCNPSTLARDCQVLGESGFQIKKIQPVDMFPHTYHIENVCLLSR